MATVYDFIADNYPLGLQKNITVNGYNFVASANPYFEDDSDGNRYVRGAPFASVTAPGPTLPLTIGVVFDAPSQIFTLNNGVVAATGDTVLGEPIGHTFEPGFQAWVVTVDENKNVKIAINGVLVFDDQVTGDITFTGTTLVGHGVGRTYRVLMEDTVEVDPAGRSNALLVGYVAPEPVDLTATGAITFTGAAAVEADEDEWVEPPPPSGDGGAVEPPPPPEPQLPPTGVPDPVVQRVSERMPAPVLDSRGFPVDWEPSSVVRETVGRFQVVVEGTDITYWNGGAVEPSWSEVEPFGSATASIQMPQVTAFHTPGSGNMSWCKGGANVTIRIKPVNGSAVTVFTGVLMSFGHDEHGTTGTFTLTVVGDLFVGDLQLRKPAFVTTPKDIGTAIKHELDSVISRRYKAMPKKLVKSATSVLGGWEPKLTGWAQQTIATAVSKGRQWTVHNINRVPTLVLKNTTTAHWSVSNGQRGVGIDLSRDWTQAPNAVYGEGIAPDGGRWRNSKFPNWRPDDTPPYPRSPNVSGIMVGHTDADTTTGNGVSTWQRRAGRPVTGRFSTGDRAATRSLQAAAGIQVDGIVGPQTWAATFATGSNTGTLDGAWIAPLAAVKQVEPRLYASDGADLGPNSAYRNNIVRVEQYINFGEGVTKTEGVKAARAILNRDSDPGWMGTITLTADPEEGSRFFVKAGQNIRVRHWRGGGTLLLHIAGVDHTLESTTLTVDTHARDYPTLDAIRARERSAVDPVRAFIKPRGNSYTPRDMPTFDAEAGGGLIPKHALFANLWTVLKIPVAAYGRVVRTEFRTTGPARPFAVAIFDRPITAAKLLSLMGNPLTATENPWNNENLDKAGLIMGWGWNKQPLGYYPKTFYTPDGETQAPVTGRFIDDAAWEYASTKAPWLWVAEIASGGCQIEGRLWPGAVD